MTGSSGNNRSERQHLPREGAEWKEVRSEGTIAGTRTDKEAEVRAMSVLRNAKSDSHRKTHPVRSGDAGRKFMHLTRGELLCESTGEVSRDHSSVEASRKAGGAKGRRTKRERSADDLRQSQRAAPRNRAGQASAAGSRKAGRGDRWWIPPGAFTGRSELAAERKEVAEDAQ